MKYLAYAIRQEAFLNGDSTGGMSLLDDVDAMGQGIQQLLVVGGNIGRLDGLHQNAADGVDCHVPVA